jgi:ATP-binding cassette, subfamily B, bacterial MsbA
MSSAKLADAWPIYRRLLGQASHYRPFLLVAAIGMIVEAAAAGAFTLLMRPMVDETFVARNPDVRLILPLAIVGLFLLRGVATFVTDYGMARTGRSVVRDLREQVLWKYLHMPSACFDATPVPSLVSRLNYDTDQVAQASSDALKIILTDTLILIALLSAMLMQSVRVTLTILVLAPVIGTISSVVGRRYRRINRGIQDGMASMAATAEQALAAQQEVKVYAAHEQEARRYLGLISRNLQLHIKVESTRALASSTVALLGAIGLAVLLYMAGYEAQHERMTAGQFVALMTAMMAMIPSLKRITNVQSVLQRGLAAAERLYETLDAPSEPDTGSRTLQRASGRIEFEAVSVHYPGQPTPALDDVRLVAEPGTVTAVVGRSGSGKSTLVRLLPRFYEPSAGEIRLDGVPLRDIRLADLRRQIALVSQKVMLFDDSVAANIAYGALAGAPIEQIREAARAANALEFIERMPQGFDSRIGENGALLSGGQRQRLAIARAFLKNAPILLLDEATAALDSESEHLVQEALAKLIPDRTTFVIAHRLSTVEHADQVLVLDAGRVIECGRHADLLQRGGLYAHLHQMQFREPEGQ